MVENGGPILCSDIMTLAIERRRIVNHEEDFEQFAKAHKGWIEGNTHRLCMTGPTATDGFIGRVVGVPSRVSGLHRYDTLDLVIHCFQAPETAASKSCRFLIS